MVNRKEKAINNTFQIVENFKSSGSKKNFYYSSGKVKLSSSFKAQLPGKVKIFSKVEIYLYNLKKKRKENL